MSASPEEPRLVRWGTKPTWQIRYRRRRISTGIRIDSGPEGRKAAEEQLRAFKVALLAPPPDVIPTVEELLTGYVQNLQRLQKPGAERANWSKRQLLRRMNGSTYDQVNVGEYIEDRTEDGVSLRTIRTELETLRAAFRWAAELDRPLIAKAPKIVLPAKGEGRVRWLTREEADQLLAECRHFHLKLFVLLGLHTAARSKAILELKWDRVNFKLGLIDYRTPGQRQSRKRRGVVPMNDVLRPELLQAFDKAESEHVIERAGGSVDSIRHGFASAVARAGLGDDVTPHVLKHTSITWMLQSGISHWDVANFASTTVEVIEGVYGHHHPDYLKDAAAALAGEPR